MLNCLIIAASLMGQAETHPLPKGTRVDYLDKGGITIVYLSLGHAIVPAGRHQIAVYAAHLGRKPEAVSEVVLNISRYGARWEYRDSHDVKIFIGNEELKIVEVKYDAQEDTENPNELCIETLHVHIPIKELNRIIDREEELKIKIGVHDTYEIAPEARNKIIKFVKAVRSGEY